MSSAAVSRPRPAEDVTSSGDSQPADADAEDLTAAKAEMHTADAPPADGLSLDSFDDDMAGEDEVQRKLDLARGYVALGETQSARALLQQVIESGNPDEIAEARHMLTTLG